MMRLVATLRIALRALRLNAEAMICTTISTTTVVHFSRMHSSAIQTPTQRQLSLNSHPDVKEPLDDLLSGDDQLLKLPTRQTAVTPPSDSRRDVF